MSQMNVLSMVTIFHSGAVVGSSSMSFYFLFFDWPATEKTVGLSQLIYSY